MSSNTANPHATRETIESVVVAVILAFLFRTFVAEAFIIPTGSMAPTLQGNHKDLACAKCGYEYQTGASCENEGREGRAQVTGTTCPICRYTTKIDPSTHREHASFAGDRILVSKFSYEIGEPQRWDVIVFKYPENAKQNYIKRLVGLPNETLRIEYGDVLAKPKGSNNFAVLRKPPHKLTAMLQLVDDTKHVPADLRNAKWPSRWQHFAESELRSSENDLTGFPLISDGSKETWMRYRHFTPSRDTWRAIELGAQNVAPPNPNGELITDFYAYNTFEKSNHDDSNIAKNGLHWVGDLAVECEVEVKTDGGKLLLDLVKGGIHHQCIINLATGDALLDIVGDGAYTFEDENGKVVSEPRGMVGQHGAGIYKIRYANVDNEIHLWVNEKHIRFDQTTQYMTQGPVVPKTSANDPGDLAPVGIGINGGTAHVNHARVLRDVYYVAIDGRGHVHDYDNLTINDIRGRLQSPDFWNELFDVRSRVEFDLADGQFFPMGDNSPESSDARLWGIQQKFVDRDLLTGKALLVYWPHPKNSPLPFTPNLGRMRLIK